MKNNEQIDCDSVMNELAALLGFKEAMALVAVHGGQKITVPAKMTSEHRLAELVGVDAALWFAQNYPGAELQIPLLSEFDSLRRTAHVHDLCCRQGMDSSFAARVLGVTQRTVQMHMNLAAKLKPTRRFLEGTRQRDKPKQGRGP
jgi:hypothetical protein